MGKQSLLLVDLWFFFGRCNTIFRLGSKGVPVFSRHAALGRGPTAQRLSISNGPYVPWRTQCLCFQSALKTFILHVHFVQIV